MDVVLRWLSLDQARVLVVAAAGCLLTVGLSVYLYYRRRGKSLKGNQPSGLPLPPGPPPLPLLGNILDIPRKREWETLTRWAEQYGDLVHVQIFGQHLIYVNSYEVASDLFEKRGSIYSDRPRLPLVNELMGLDWNFGLIHYGDSWRKHRRMFVSEFGGSAVQKFYPIHERATALLLERLLESPGKFIDHIRLHAGQLIMLSVYGIFVDSINHPYVRTAESVMDHFSEAALPGAWIVDALPFLKKLPPWFPGAHYRRVAAQWAEDVRKLRIVPFQKCKTDLADGRTAPIPCFVIDMLQEHGHYDDEIETMVQDCAALAYGAGSDTSVGSLTSFMLAMVLYPEVPRKAQEEIDKVVGTSRLAAFEDRKNLPYIAAVLKETERWHTVGPQALPHRVVEDDVYKGCFIPKGSIVVGNVWGMAHDPSVYPDPFDFKPERFLDAEGRLDFTATDPQKFSFGFGRRLCAGYHFAEATMFIVFVRILQCFNITNAKDSAGNPIPVRLNPSSGMVSHPEPFNCSITPRSDQAVGLIRQAAAEAATDFGLKL